MLKILAIENYRSLKDITVELGQLTAITGPNGSGKSNMYRALGLIADLVREGALHSLAAEGGLQNVLYAGHRPPGPVALRLGIATDDVRYAIELGLPQLGPFRLDPEVKREVVWSGVAPRPATLLADRKNQHIRLLNDAGTLESSTWKPRSEESMLATLTDPSLSPELYFLREAARSWRFYDNLRVDAHAPARRPTPATFTPSVAFDGGNFAAALATVIRVGNNALLQATVGRAFDGASVDVTEDDRGIARVEFHSGLRRGLDASELSDGTLRFLMLACILLPPRPPGLLVLNEPEASLHPSLLPELGKLIALASKESQVIVVTHAQELVAAMGPEAYIIQLQRGSETSVADQLRFEGPEWIWPKR